MVRNEQLSSVLRHVMLWVQKTLQIFALFSLTPDFDMRILLLSDLGSNVGVAERCKNRTQRIGGLILEGIRHN